MSAAAKTSASTMMAEVQKNGVMTLAFIADVEVISCIILGMRRLQPAWVVRCRTTWVGSGRHFYLS